MTRVFLAAGVAALAIAAPATAKPGDHGGGKDRQASQVQWGGGQQAQRTQRAERPQRATMQRAQRAERPQRMAMQRADRPQRAERANRIERQQRVAQRAERANRIERQQRVAQRAERANRIERQQRVAQRAERANRIERQQRVNRIDRAQERLADRQQLRDQRIVRVDQRQLARDRRIDRLGLANAGGIGFGVGGCPPGLLDKGCVPPGQAMKANRALSLQAFRDSDFARLAALQQTRVFAPVQAVQYVGQPLSSVSNLLALSALPSAASYLYPDNDDYYYRYGGGYVYRVDRDNDLINWILPALAGGFLPGQVLPNSYMNSYVPSYYGFNNFYPDSPYECNRYANGVIYQVDCMSGMIEDVVPLYASGYGVGQMLPASYGYYNVPNQYRSLYYNTDDYNYWYAPGAIYQYDPQSSLITSVAALLAPGFTIGQPMPAGYGMYNVPLAYRDTYYDTDSAWYRYNNGYIYQVDPTTQLVTAIVASILT